MKTIIAMALIFVLMLVALLNEVDGTALATCCALLAGLAGYTAGRVKK